ncbi:MAG: HAD-IA family hydrolase [Sporichthyaceae bacterium]|nr:HAD-IA family hydrolase [Sporichthyaceae bacterium]
MTAAARSNGSEPAGDRPFDVLLCDLDGVLRVWDPKLWPPIEERHGLRPGAIYSTAFQAELLMPPVLGQISDEQWRLAVARELAGEYGIETAAAAVADWAAPTGRVEPAALALVQQVRAAGIRTVLVTNATSRLDRDLAALGLDEAVDAVVNSSRIGVVKPDREIYLHAAEVGGAEPRRCLFVDDTPANVVGAETVGMTALLYTGPDMLPVVATTLGLELAG